MGMSSPIIEAIRNAGADVTRDEEGCNHPSFLVEYRGEFARISWERESGWWGRGALDRRVTRLVQEVFRTFDEPLDIGP